MPPSRGSPALAGPPGLPGRVLSRLATIGRMSQANFWRFSLRELLLAMTAAGALIALAVKSYPSQLTPFFHQFDARDELNGLFADLGVKVGSSASGSRGSWSGGEGRKSWDFGSHQNQYPLGQIGFEYKKRVEARLRACGCMIKGSRRFGGRTEDSLSAFGYSDQRGATSGEFFAEFVDLANGNFRVDAFCIEFTKR